jgi:hypothetical protein
MVKNNRKLKRIANDSCFNMNQQGRIPAIDRPALIGRRIEHQKNQSETDEKVKRGLASKQSAHCSRCKCLKEVTRHIETR